jgi:hypothetical protein
VKVRSCWLGGALLALACGPSGTSSTGVGNPSVSLSLLMIGDDADDELAGSGGEANAAGSSAQAPGSGGGNTGTDGGTSSDSNSAGVGNGGAPDSSSDAPLGKAQIRHALLSLAKLRFFPCDTARGEQVVEGPFVIDLVDSALAPPAFSVPDVPGGYCGLDAPLVPAQAPPALAGRSLFFDGVRADGTLFLLYADMQATLKLRARPGVSWSASAEQEQPQFLWAFRPRRWLTKAEVDAADSEPFAGARAIVIDIDRHPLLYAKVRARLAGKSALYPDLDHDGLLEPNERARTLGDGLEDAD